MKIVGIDTSSYSGSVSLVIDNQILGECILNTGPKHSENIVASLDWLLNTVEVERNELEAVAVSVGPGSFTSLRVGVTIAKSLAYTLGLKIIGVSSLEILAYNIPNTENKICPIIDAKRGEIYSAQFEFKGGRINQIKNNTMQSIQELCSGIKEKTVFLGDAVPAYRIELADNLGELAVFAGEPFDVPRASNCAMIGQHRLDEGHEDDPIALVPDYIRKPDVQTGAKKN